MNDVRMTSRAAAVVGTCSEALFRAVFEQSPLGVALVDSTTGCLIEMNERLAAIIGRNREELASAGWKGVTHPDDLPAEMENVTRLHAGESAGFQMEKRYLRPDDSIVWAHLTVTAVARGPEDVPLYLALVEDITDRKQLELSLGASEEMFRLAFSNANTGMCLVDLAGRLMLANDKMSSIFGYSRRELEGMSVNDLALPDDAVLSPAFMDQAMRGAVESMTFEKRYRHKEGARIHCLVASSLVRDAQGQPWYFISQVLDITQIRQAEERLRLSEERHRMLADNARDVIWTMDFEGRFTYVSPSVEKLRGYTPAEVMQQTMEEALCPASYAIARQAFGDVISAMKAGLPVENFRGELEQPCKDGSTVWTEVSTCLSLDVQGTYREILGVTRDITERKRYEHELRLARDAAEAANRAKSEFLANMSHEIRTPLNAVLGLAQLLEKEQLSPEQHDMVGRIRTAGRSLLGILNDILDISKIEAGQLRIVVQPFPLQPLLEHLESLHGGFARSKGLSFGIEMATQPSGSLVGDSLRLEQILNNLISNAIKFTEQGAIRLWVQPQESTAKTARLRFEVSDTGVGIPPEVQETLFTPFTQADGSITRRFGGTGLGLSISRSLVELMGGKIGVESAVGAGSTFWFEIPFDRSDDVVPGPGNIARDVIPAGPRLNGVRVLVVDDSDINRDLIDRALAREGADAVLARDGREALDTLRDPSRRVDAVLMDVQMPVMDGLTATRLLRSELGLTDLPVIAFTAGVLPEDRRKSRDAGVDDFLPKPVDLEEMVALLLTWTAPVAGAATRDGSSPFTETGSLREGGGPARDRNPSSAVPEIPGIDTAWVVGTYGNDREFFRELLEMFLLRFGDAPAQIRTYLAQEDRRGATQRLHALKGTAGNLGATALMGSVRDLEQAVIDGQSDPTPLLERVAAHLAALVEGFASWFPECEKVLPGHVEAPPLDPLRLEVLRESLAWNRLSALDLFAELEPALLGVYGRKTARSAGMAIRELRFADALRLLEQAD